MKDKILEFLKVQKDLISLTDISKQLEISYPTVLKYCHILYAEGAIEMKDYGNVKLVKLVENGKTKKL